MTGRPNGSERSQQIAADIDRTRASVDRTIDALVGKLTPQQLVLELAGVMRSGTSTLATSVVETARQHPVPATIIGLGLGMLFLERTKGGSVASSVADTAEGTGAAAREVLLRAEEKASHATEKIGEVTHKVGESVGDVGQQVREKVDQAKEQAKETVQQVKTQARQQVKSARLGFWQTMEKEPLAVGAAAVAIGMVAGLSLPRTQKEDELMGETRDRLLGDARERGRDMLHKGQAVARVAAETIRSQAEREGLTPAAVAEKVRQAGEETAEKVRGIAHEAKETVRQEAERQHLVPQGGGPSGTASHQSWNQGAQTWDRPAPAGSAGGTTPLSGQGSTVSTSGTDRSSDDGGGSGA
jgi:gas vesicle protein